MGYSSRVTPVVSVASRGTALPRAQGHCLEELTCEARTGRDNYRFSGRPSVVGSAPFQAFLHSPLLWSRRGPHTPCPTLGSCFRRQRHGRGQARGLVPECFPRRRAPSAGLHGTCGEQRERQKGQQAPMQRVPRARSLGECSALGRSLLCKQLCCLGAPAGGVRAAASAQGLVRGRGFGGAGVEQVERGPWQLGAPTPPARRPCPRRRWPGSREGSGCRQRLVGGFLIPHSLISVTPFTPNPFPSRPRRARGEAFRMDEPARHFRLLPQGAEPGSAHGPKGQVAETPEALRAERTGAGGELVLLRRVREASG